MSKRSETITKNAPERTVTKPRRKRGRLVSEPQASIVEDPELAERRADPQAKRPGGQPGNANAFKHGFYASTYTAEELKGLVDPAKIRAEQDMLRTKALRLARLTPLKKITTQELQTLARLLATVARIDALERTLLLARRKPGDLDDGLFDALAKMDPYDL